MTSLSGELQKAQDEVVALRMQLAGILESKSWRLTAPLRFVLRQLRGLASPVSQEPLPEPASGGPLSYTQWIAGPETEIKRLRRRDMPGNGKVWAPRLALVVFAALQGLIAISTNGKFKGVSLDILVPEITARIVVGMRPASDKT